MNRRYLQRCVAFGAKGHAGNGMHDGQETIEGHQDEGVDTANGTKWVRLSIV